MIKPKRQNIIYLTGWIVSADWVEHEQLGEQVLACIIRTDRVKYGGHHTVYFRNDLAQRLYIALSVFMAEAEPNRYESLENIPFDRMDDFFLMITVDGVLFYNDIFALRANCLNLTGRQRNAVNEHLAEMQRRSWRS